MGQEDILRILGMSTVAVVGLSPHPARPSHAVAKYLKAVGYKVFPVNPGQAVILGEKCYPNLAEIPEAVEVVDVFRRPEHVYPVVMDAIRIGAKAVWMQDGIVHDLAAEKARESGLIVVMDDCMMRAHRRYGGPIRKAIPAC